MRHAILAALLLMAGCATDDAYIRGALEDLHSGRMLLDICAAGADTPECLPDPSRRRL